MTREEMLIAHRALERPTSRISKTRKLSSPLREKQMLFSGRPGNGTQHLLFDEPLPVLTQLLLMKPFRLSGNWQMRGSIMIVEHVEDVLPSTRKSRLYG